MYVNKFPWVIDTQFFYLQVGKTTEHSKCAQDSKSLNSLSFFILPEWEIFQYWFHFS